jgi:diacylglycerol kinase (ATP)
MKGKIHFIINSRSEKSKLILKKQIDSTFFWHNNFDVFMWESLYKGHALELTQKAISDKSSTIVACGGDGTINEVARYVIETDIPLGIVPLGSGNGLARHFKIPLHIKGALQVIKTRNIVQMNAGLANQNFFLCNTGVSFDTHFINAYQNIPSRGFFSYFKSLKAAFASFSVQKHTLEFDSQKRVVTPFLLMICNTNQFGYDFSLTPNASVSDGKFEMIIFKLFLDSRFDLNLSSSFLETLLVSEVTITPESDQTVIQYDGEINHSPTNDLQIRLHPKSLGIIVPKQK